jgi:hypothetical protein
MVRPREFLTLLADAHLQVERIARDDVELILRVATAEVVTRSRA